MLEWSDPPKARQGPKGKWSAIFAELKAQPGTWAKLYEGKARNAYSLTGRLKKQAGEGFQFVSRSLNDQTGVAIEDRIAGVWGQYSEDSLPDSDE